MIGHIIIQGVDHNRLPSVPVIRVEGEGFRLYPPIRGVVGGYGEHNLLTFGGCTG